MVSLEQVKLLESKVTRVIEYVNKVTEENRTLKEKLDSYQKRTDDLEILIQQFKEDQNRIEDGILSALDRLNQFEDALENKLSEKETLSPEITLPEEQGKKSGKAQDAVPDTSEKAESKKNGGEDKKKAAPMDVTEENEPDPAASGAELDIF